MTENDYKTEVEILSFFNKTDLKINITRAWGISHPIDYGDHPSVETHSPELNVYELILQGSCNRTFYYNGESIHITEPTIIFLPHCMTKVTNPMVREYRIKTYYSEGIVALHFTCDTPLATTVETFPCKAYFNEIQALFLKLKQTHNDKLLAYNSISVSILYQIFAMLEKRSSSSYLSGKQYNIIKDSISYIDENYLDISLDYRKLAADSNISLTYYHKLFKKKTGLSPNQYILMKKLNYACNLLTAPNLSINRISEMSGFSSVYYFSKIFKKHFLVSPHDYRKNFYATH